MIGKISVIMMLTFSPPSLPFERHGACLNNYDGTNKASNSLFVVSPRNVTLLPARHKVLIFLDLYLHSNIEIFLEAQSAFS